MRFPSTKTLLAPVILRPTANSSSLETWLSKKIVLFKILTLSPSTSIAIAIPSPPSYVISKLEIVTPYTPPTAEINSPNGSSATSFKLSSLPSSPSKIKPILYNIASSPTIDNPSSSII